MRIIGRLMAITPYPVCRGYNVLVINTGNKEIKVIVSTEGGKGSEFNRARLSDTRVNEALALDMDHKMPWCGQYHSYLGNLSWIPEDVVTQIGIPPKGEQSG